MGGSENNIPHTPVTIERLRWQEGRCPCCGTSDFENGLNEEDTSYWVAEGVRICAYCIEREHHAEDVLPTLLRAIANDFDASEGRYT